MATQEDTKLLQELQDRFQASIDHEVWRQFTNNAATDFEFREGKQWTDTEIAELKQRGQAATVENEIKPIIDRVIGQYKKQKTRIIYRGRNIAEGQTGSDETRANILSDLALHIQQRSAYEFEEGDMFDDGNVCGFGVLEVDIDFDDALQPEVRIKYENCLDIFPDPNSKRYNWNDDAEYLNRAKWVSLKKARKMYPEKAKDLATYANTNPVVNITQAMEKNNYFDERTQRVRLVEQWYKSYTKRKIALLDTGPVDVTNFNKRQEKQLKEKFPDVAILEKVEPRMKMAVFCGNVLLESKDSPFKHNLFKWVPYFVHRKKNGEPYSMVRMLKDPNMEINKRRSKALHLLNTNQAVYEEGAIRDKDELLREMAKPDGLIEFRKDKAFEIVKNVEVAATQMHLQAESKQAMSRISGISDESMARHSEIRSGIGLQRKQMQTDLIILPIFDNLRRTRLMVGKLIYELIKQYYTEEKIFHVTDDINKARQVTFDRGAIKAVQEGIYDVVIEEMPDTATVQDEQFRMIGDLLTSMNLPANYSMALLPFMLQLSQLRNKEEIKKQIETLSQPPPELPKASLNFVWSELPAEQQIAIANFYQLPELAQAIASAPARPMHVVKEDAGIEKIQIKADTDLMKEAIKTSKEKEEKKNVKRSSSKS